MIKLNKKIRSGGHKTAKVKVPKIEINECKVKTKDQKKLENEMFQQAKEARTLLDRLLIEDCTNYDEHGRLRSNSLNATVENLILSTHNNNININSSDYFKFMKPRGSAPTIPSKYKRHFFKRQKSSPGNSQSSSPSSSPEAIRKAKKAVEHNMKLARKHDDIDNKANSSNCQSPQTKRVCEPPTINIECMDYNETDKSTTVTTNDNNQMQGE